MQGMNEESRTISARPRGLAGGSIFIPPTTGCDPAWFALYVQVNHEKEVAQRLQQKSIDCYLPLLECWSKRRDRRKKINSPLFPGYVFVHTVLDNYTNVNILKTPGTVYMLKNSEGPLIIPDYQIENLRAMMDKAEEIALHPYLVEGAYVQVVRGPLQGCIGIMVRQNPKKGKLVVSLDIIKKSVSVELDMEDVEPVSAPSSNIVCS